MKPLEPQKQQVQVAPPPQNERNNKKKICYNNFCFSEETLKMFYQAI